MGPKDARLAAELLQAPVVIPIHYSTWPVIAQDPEAFKADVEATTTSKVWVVKPGSTVEL
jgi:L-ascorbate metabolism protein UlaG (beta-lactamase superfamily)